MENIDRWCDWYASRGSSSGTVKLRRFHLMRFKTQVGDLLAVTEEDVTRHLLQFAEQAYDTRKSIQSSLRSFYHWALRRRLIDHDPTFELDKISGYAALPRPVPEDLLAQGLRGADVLTRRVLLLGGWGGLRLSEICATHSDNILPQGLYVWGKGAKERIVPLHPSISQALEGVEGWVFPSNQRRGFHMGPDAIASRVEKALPRPYSCHSLRHRFATRTYLHTKDIKAVQQLLGHSDLRTTQRYVLVGLDAMRDTVFALDDPAAA